MSNKVFVDEDKFKELENKVVVITGGGNGIGAATVRYLDHAGAHVVFGDYDNAAGEKMLSSLSNKATFVQMDASKYEDNIKLFKTALEKHGAVHHAIACAGIIERGKWFDPELTVETVQKPETNQTIDINFIGVAYFTRIAVVYLRHRMKQGEDKSIVLISSAAGFRDSPGLAMYQCTKHAVLGLLRTTRKIIYERDHIRVNAICPAISETNMTANMIESMKQSGQSINSAEGVAKFIVGLEVAKDMNGKAIYVEGNEGFEFMDGLERTMELWLGDEPTKRLRAYLEQIKTGDVWKIK